jgi:hypothetical protein
VPLRPPAGAEGDDELDLHQPEFSGVYAAEFIPKVGCCMVQCYYMLRLLLLLYTSAMVQWNRTHTGL